MTIDRLRVIFDCNVLVQAVANEDGRAAAALREFESGRLEVFVSRATLRELCAVLRYPSIREKNPDLTGSAIAAFIGRLAYRATWVHRVRHVLDYPRAKQDEPYIDLAATVKADYLVSRDKDLLSLMTGHSPVCKQFRRITHPLKILNPVEFLIAIGRL